MRITSWLAAQIPSSYFLCVQSINLIAKQPLRAHGEPSVLRNQQTHDPRAPAPLKEVSQKMQEISSRHVISRSEGEDGSPEVGLGEEWY